MTELFVPEGSYESRVEAQRSKEIHLQARDNIHWICHKNGVVNLFGVTFVGVVCECIESENMDRLSEQVCVKALPLFN